MRKYPVCVSQLPGVSRSTGRVRRFAGGGLSMTSEHLGVGRGVRSGACLLAWRSPVPAGWLPRRQPSDSGARLVPASLRFMLDARAFMISTLRSQVGFAAAVAHARLRLPVLASRALWGVPAAAASRYASSARAFISPTAFEQARGGALGAGGGRVGFAGGTPWAVSSDRVGRGVRSAPRVRFGFGRLRARRADVRMRLWVGMVVRFVCVIRVSVCLVCVVRLPPESFYRLFTGTVPVLYSTTRQRHRVKQLQKVKRTLVSSSRLLFLEGQWGWRWSWPYRQRKWRPKSRQGLPR